MASLQDKLHNKYDSCTIPPSGEVWNKRFKSLGELPAEAFASAAPSFIRQQVELEESVRKAIGPTSGGVPSRLRKTFNELAMGSQPTSTHDRRTISSDTVIPNFLNEPEIDSDDDAS
ncbi:hypothetical protein I316_04706 [Kwoniella heveanensis BCC8398]|uniref:Uncharacterized protein n=1 Tax=Kwoniella heveanensis BCC8398 TaxID=1296120 RepID=A0A1B9GRE3_9TREE|nr:hypothetical protein I316_04706 [Kwoniella heveanensis BCC8398]